MHAHVLVRGSLIEVEVIFLSLPRHDCAFDSRSPAKKALFQNWNRPSVHNASPQKPPKIFGCRFRCGPPMPVFHPANTLGSAARESCGKNSQALPRGYNSSRTVPRAARKDRATPSALFPVLLSNGALRRAGGPSFVWFSWHGLGLPSRRKFRLWFYFFPRKTAAVEPQPRAPVPASPAAPDRSSCMRGACSMQGNRFWVRVLYAREFATLDEDFA